MTTLGYVMVALLYLAALSPVIMWAGRRLRAWLRDMKPRVTRVPCCHGDHLVSAQRARMTPDQFTQVTPWCWRKRT
jgi:hypothetical protein